MSKPDWGNLTLESGVLREQTPEASRLLLWLPMSGDGRIRHWERIGNVPGAPIRLDQGIGAVQSTAIPAQQRSPGWFAKLLAWLGRGTEGQTWVLPNGQAAEQTGSRQTDLLLVWAEDEANPLDETRIRERWPQCRQIQQLGKNLFLIRGVASQAAATELGHGQAPAKVCKQAQELLTAARQAGDRRREAAALIDLGAVTSQGGDALAGLVLLHEALTLVRRQGDGPREIDALLNLGMAQKAASQAGPALGSLEQALALARQAGDRFAEKLILEHLGSLLASQGERAGAIGHYEQALSLAQALGHHPHEAELLWQLAIQHAELGQHDQAVRRGQAALTLWTPLGHPNLKMFADNLEHYRTRAAAFAWVGAGSPDPPQAALASQDPAGAGPGLLRMALSVGRAMVQYVGSGMKTVASAIQQERLQTCGRCEHHTGVRCRLCGCFTSVKTRLPHESCPLGKWAKK